MVERVATWLLGNIAGPGVDVQVEAAPGLPAFNIVGLADKAVSEAKERVRAALDRLRPRTPCPPYHRQSRTGRPAEGRQSLRSADRARADGSDRRYPRRRAGGLHGPGRTGLDGSIAPVAGDCRPRLRRSQGTRADLPRRMRRGSRLGQPRDRDRRGASLIQLANHFKGTQVLFAAAAENPRGRGVRSISPTSKDRKARSARSKSQRPADTI